jgi:hypothetical protein
VCARANSTDVPFLSSSSLFDMQVTQERRNSGNKKPGNLKGTVLINPVIPVSASLRALSMTAKRMQAGGGAPNTEHLDPLKKGLTPLARRAHRTACGRGRWFVLWE